jgi:hypothetical protein
VPGGVTTHSWLGFTTTQLRIVPAWLNVIAASSTLRSLRPVCSGSTYSFWSRMSIVMPSITTSLLRTSSRVWFGRFLLVLSHSSCAGCAQGLRTEKSAL